MKSTSASILEYEPLRALVGRYVSSPLGRAELERLSPHEDRERLERELAEAGEAIAYLRSAAAPQSAGSGAPGARSERAGGGRAAPGAAIRIHFSRIQNIAPAVEKLRIEGSILEPREIAELTGFLDCASDARSILNAAGERFPRLAARARSIAEFGHLLQELEGKLLPDGAVADRASAALARLRRDIEKQKRSIQESLERFLRANPDAVQEEFVTIRGERFVVPVVAGRERKIQGVVHGSSSSGRTLFLEPLETIDLNNELVRLSEEELREVARILLEISDRLRGYGEAIEAAVAVMGALELVFAKARFALDFDCAIPRFTPAGAPRLRLLAARHPLLEDVLKKSGRRIVPISLELDRGFGTLLISGPNTGGKTVALKTAGLLSLMAQSGLPVPCREAEFPVFEQILADIGDHQSIEQSLSTFSAHMSRIREMALEVTPGSLVLLDEVGAATDPEEGGALGVAIVDHFRAAGAFTIASTHLLALKMYGASTDSVINGSMGFDEQTLEPTYELRTGLPGKSAGLDIAARLGMPEDIMKRARASLSRRDQDVARFLAELNRRSEELERLERELRGRQAQLEERERRLAKEWEQRESAKLRELERRLEAVLQRFEARAEEEIRKITAGPAGGPPGGPLGPGQPRKAAEQARRRAGKARRELREEFETTVLATGEDSRRGELCRPVLEVGARVRLKDLREPARVRRKLSHDLIEVEAGFMKLQVPIDDVLEVLPGLAAPARLPANVSFQPAPALSGALQEINVIGQRAEEACEAVDQFLDRAVMATASRVRIIHGHGMGVLRKAIGELLAKNPHVSRHYPAPQQEGGAGATIVELRE